MNDSKIKKHPTGSLTRRILLVAVFLLVIPLFFNSFFQYRTGYATTLREWQEDLDVVVKERAYVIEETARLTWHVLEVAPEALQAKPSPAGSPSRFAAVQGNNIIIGTKEHLVAVPIERIGKEIPFLHPVRITITDLNGKVLWENKPALTGDVLEAVDVIDDTDLIIVLQMAKNDVEALRRSTYYEKFAWLILFVGVCGGLLVYLFSWRMSRPLMALWYTMRKVADGDESARYKPDPMGFEINDLGFRFNETLEALFSHREEREKLASELRIGHEIQENLLPKEVPGIAGVRVETEYVAAKEVNGDFYDLVEVKSGSLLMAVCDTAGKGISACLFSLGLRSMIRAVAAETEDLEEIVKRVNDLYYADAHETAMFSTLWIGIYNPNTLKLCYCSQGHPPAILCRGGKVDELWTEGIALGAQKVDVVITKEVTLKRGDELWLYTDGVIEAHDKKNQLFGKEKLYALIKKFPTAKELVKEVEKFSSGRPQHDDLTLVHLVVEEPRR